MSVIKAQLGIDIVTNKLKWKEDRHKHWHDLKVDNGGSVPFTGWSEDDGDPANISANGGTLSFNTEDAPDAPAVPQLQVEDAAVADYPLFTIDQFGNVSLNGFGPNFEIGELGNVQMFRYPDGSQGGIFLNGMNLNILASIHEYIGKAWTANRTIYTQCVIHPTGPNENGHLYIAETSGETGSSEPIWPTDGSTVDDGTVTWQDAGTAVNPDGRFNSLIRSACYVVGNESGTPGNYTDGYKPQNVYEAWPGYGNSRPTWGVEGTVGAEFKQATEEAPADADVPTSAVLEWYDDTEGAQTARFKARDSAGTLATGQLSLLSADGTEFKNVSKPTINNATAADIIAALVTLGLVIDGT